MTRRLITLEINAGAETCDACSHLFDVGSGEGQVLFCRAMALPLRAPGRRLPECLAAEKGADQ